MVMRPVVSRERSIETMFLLVVGREKASVASALEAAALEEAASGSTRARCIGRAGCESSESDSCVSAVRSRLAAWHRGDRARPAARARIVSFSFIIISISGLVVFQIEYIIKQEQSNQAIETQKWDYLRKKGKIIEKLMKKAGIARLA